MQTIDITFSNGQSLSNVPVLHQRGQWLVHPTIYKGELITKETITQQQNKRRNEKRRLSKPVPTERETLYTIALDTRLGLLDHDRFYCTVKGNNLRALKKIIDFIIASFDQERIRVKDKGYLKNTVFPILKDKLKALPGYYCLGQTPLEQL